MSPDELDDIVHMAQALARNCGYHVFPCCLPDKLPAIPKARGGRGFHDASTDPAVITELWRRGPGNLIGIRTGEMSFIDILDVDVKHETAVAWWEVASKRIPPTRLYRTMSGGLHAYFRHAAGVTNNQSKLAHGVDTRGAGGYGIFWYAAGFECIDHSPPAPWPDWLLECILWQRPEPSPVPHRSDISLDKAIAGVLRVVSGAREGERNHVLFWGACRLRERVTRGQIGQREASALLIGAARAAGLQAVEAQRTVASAWRAG